jgi:cell division protein FtsN
VTLLHKPGAPMAEKTAPAKPVIQPSPEPAKPAPAAELPKGPPAPEMARKETRPVEIKPSAPVAAAEEKTAAEKSASGQVALLSKPRDPVIEKKPAVLPSIPKALEGFIIQLAFKDKDKARNWAEAMQRRGFAVSLTEAGAEGALRVRLGNFSAREDAERQLRSFKQDGLTGIIINLPQAYRPEARSSVP